MIIHLIPHSGGDHGLKYTVNILYRGGDDRDGSEEGMALWLGV